MSTYSFGEKLRQLREDGALPLRKVAVLADIDPAILSKIERGQRRATREQVTKLSDVFNVVDNDLVIAWLSDKIVYEVEDEDTALTALLVAEEKVRYITKNKAK